MLDFSYEHVESVGLFAVHKKGGKQRLIVDARRANRWFGDPTPVNLATGESLSELVRDDAEQLYVGHIDIVNAFYALELPEVLRKYFCLKPVSERELTGDVERVRSRVRDRVLYPRLKVVPMGWSHALYWCQVMHEDIMARAGFGPERRIMDKHVVPAMCTEEPVVHLEYVDNFAAFDTAPERVQVAVEQARRALEKHGLPVHEEELCTPVTELLGWLVDGRQGRLAPTQKRVWRLRQAIAEVLTRKRCSGQQMQKLLGHCTFVGLVRRESLSCFNEVYRWIESGSRSHSRPVSEGRES
jgi:hypothetical protein